jgi:hypothetical protein
MTLEVVRLARSHQPVRARIALFAVVSGVGFIAITSPQGFIAQPNCHGHHNCVSPSPKPTPSPTASSLASPSPLASPAASTPQSPSPSPSPMPIPASVGSAAPPAGGYLTSLAPAGSWSSLPSDAQCAAQVHQSTWEPRPENLVQNNTMPAPGAMAASFAARPRAQGATYNSLWDTWLLPRIDGQFTGTTDEIIQWAACKWGLPDNLIRADAVTESTWFQYLNYMNAGCYWLRGCGDAFSSATSSSVTYCKGIAASGGHDYQLDPVTTAGAYPYRPAAGLCPKTFSILGIMSWDDPAWEAPYPAYAGNQNGTFPFTRDSTAAAVDYWAGYIRGCYEGWITWLNPIPGDIWGCLGAWYSGDWYSTAANGYISEVQKEETNHTWLSASFVDSRQQYQCDPSYGCPD